MLQHIFFHLLLFGVSAALALQHIEYNITVPEYEVKDEDAYLCVAQHLPPKPHKLVGITPHATADVVHHILLYGCVEPYQMPDKNAAAVWRCDMSAICKGNNQYVILYGWGSNAPELHLPEGVGYSVGPNTHVNFIVMQVHYLKPRPAGDRSGVGLMLRPTATPYAAGLLSYVASFTIPARTKQTLVPNTCCYKGHQPLTMFAVRVHAHDLGRNIYMERQMWNKSGIERLVERDPRLPQSFIPTQRHVLWPGDRLEVTCQFDSSDRDRVTVAGNTHADEMCNMYVMLYAKTAIATMCFADSFLIDEAQPGALPRKAAFELDPDPFWQPPKPEGDGTVEGLFGDATSVTTGPDGTLWALYRGNHTWGAQTFEFNNRVRDQHLLPEAVVVQLEPDTGAVLRRWGAGLFSMPHMITVDLRGDVWVVDVGLHQVLKFSPDGKQLMAVGEAFVPGNDHSHFCKPTQVFVLRDESFVVSDGYCNARVAKFDKDGKFIGASEPIIPPVVHTLLVDECEGRVYVGSREQGKVYVLDLQTLKPHAGEGPRDLSRFGRVWALRFGPYGEQMALMWRQGEDAKLVNVQFDSLVWTLPGTAQLSPHDFVLGAAPVPLTGAGDRLFAVYLANVGEACGSACGPLQKFVLVPHGFTLPHVSALAMPPPAGAAVAGAQQHAAPAPMDAAAGDAQGSGSGGGSDVMGWPTGWNAAVPVDKEAPQDGGAAAGGGGADEDAASSEEDYDYDYDYEQEAREEGKQGEGKTASTSPSSVGGGVGAGKEADKAVSLEDYEQENGGKGGAEVATAAAVEADAEVEREGFSVFSAGPSGVRSIGPLGWAIAAVVVAALAVAIVRLSRTALNAYLSPRGDGGGGDSSHGSGDGRGAAGRRGGGSGGGGRAGRPNSDDEEGGAAARAGAPSRFAREVEAARERERLLTRGRP